ncbi:MAG: HAD-IC family P-type ATPase [Polyangiaceae bacterium]|nr:HAD-IC family P-type ATPase [Polyangiaceae bacterium]
MPFEVGAAELTATEKPQWWALEGADVLARVGSSPQGLSGEEAARRLAEVGPNLLKRKSRESPFTLLFRQINDPLIWVLIASSVLAIALGKVNDGLVVGAVVVINTIIGFVQEYRAGKAIEALAEMVPEFATTLRDGVAVRLPVAEIVPGDVVTLASGDKGPADMRLLASKNLRVEEAALTGESVPTEKAVTSVERDVTLGDRTSMVFGGTLVRHGTATAVVVATGERTELGRVSELLDQAPDLKTPLTIALGNIAKLITIGVLALTAVMVAVGTARAVHAGLSLGAALANSSVFAISLAVGAIPEGLPAIVTVALAVGVRRMAARRAIVRRLPAIETLGSTTVVCTDKTGTLTRNEMTVQRVLVGSRTLGISGVGYAPFGTLTEGATELDQTPREVHDLLRDAALVNDATLEQREGRWQITGDPTEAALVVAAEKAGVDVPAARATYRRLDVIPFDSELKLMVTLHEFSNGPRRLLVKGAPEVVAARAARMVDGTPVDADAVGRDVRSLASQGLRVLAIAARDWTDERTELREGDARGLTFLGLVGMIDPPRLEAMEAIRACQRAGITVKMITGDHRLTAAAIGRALGLILDQPTIAGNDVERMNDTDLRQAVARTSVFARVAAEHKLRLVRAMQENGAVVAMTGDGVNDAPALKQANIGVAMGTTGTSVAKEAADIVLTDDNFATIVAAVEEGRRVYDNLVKSLAFVLPTNLGLALILMFAVAFFPFDEVTGELLLPIQPTQILWINLVASVTLAVPLAFEAAEPDVMLRPPRDPKASPLSGFVVFRTALVAVLMAAGAVALPVYEYHHQLGGGHTHAIALATAQTMAITSVIFFQIFYLLHSRSLRGALWEVGVFNNGVIFLGIALLVGLQALVIYAPFMQTVFDTAPLSGRELALAAVVGASILPVVSLEKAIRRRYGSARTRPPRRAI